MRILVAALVLAIGCGGSDDDDPLAGSWFRTEGSCAIGPSFSRGMDYEFDMACTLASGIVGMQAEVGTYTITGSRIDFTPTHATCPGLPPGFVNYSVTAMSLTFVTPDGIHTYRRNTLAVGGGGGSATFGCYKGGVFTPSQLAPL